MLTKKQLQKILDAIEKRMLAFSLDTLGEVSLTADELKKAKALGLTRRNVKRLIVDPAKYGRLISLLPEKVRESLTLKEIESKAAHLKPMTDVEKKAIEYAEVHAGEYIRGLKDSMLKDARTLVSGSAIDAVRESVVSNIKERKTISELKSELFDRFDDRSRDWRRVASTEVNNAIQFGIAGSIKDSSDEGADQLVFKRPNPDACPRCLDLYLSEDRVTPKIFKLSELAISNVGRKSRDFLPTVGGVHPRCFCQLHVIPEGFGFKKRSTVQAEFIDNGKTYKVGQQISDEEKSRMSSANKRKLKEEAILEFEGEDNV